MSKEPEFAPELVEQAHIAGGRAYAEGGGVDDVVNAVLTAVAPTLIAEGQMIRCEAHIARAEDAEKAAATAYQRGMVDGARQVLAEVETEAEKFDLYTNIAEKVADAAHEAVARIEGGA